MRLFLCRHGDAVDGGDGLADEHRWLTSGGRAQATAVGQALSRFSEIPGLIVTSPLVRAVQTAEGLAHAIGSRDELGVDDALAPGGSLGRLLAHLVDLPPDARVLVVGHEPQMSGWGAALLGRPQLPVPFGRACVLALDFAADVEPGRARAAFFLRPDRLLREPI